MLPQKCCIWTPNQLISIRSFFPNSFFFLCIFYSTLFGLHAEQGWFYHCKGFIPCRKTIRRRKKMISFSISTEEQMLFIDVSPFYLVKWKKGKPFHWPLRWMTFSIDLLIMENTHPCHARVITKMLSRSLVNKK